MKVYMIAFISLVFTWGSLFSSATFASGEPTIQCTTITIHPQTGELLKGYIRAQINPSPKGWLKIAPSEQEVVTKGVKFFQRHSDREVQADRSSMAVINYLKIDAAQVNEVLGLIVMKVSQKPTGYLFMFYNKAGDELGRGGIWEYSPQAEPLFFACEK